MILYIPLTVCHNRVTVERNRAKVDKMNNQNLYHGRHNRTQNCRLLTVENLKSNKNC